MEWPWNPSQKDSQFLSWHLVRGNKSSDDVFATWRPGLSYFHIWIITLSWLLEQHPAYALVWWIGESSGQEWIPLISHPDPSHSPNHQLSWKGHLGIWQGWGGGCPVFLLVGGQLLYSVVLASALCIHMPPPSGASLQPQGHHRALSSAPCVI